MQHKRSPKARPLSEPAHAAAQDSTTKCRSGHQRHWTSERIADLVQRWNDGETSFVLARRYNISRSAVLSKIKRLREKGYKLRHTIEATAPRLANRDRGLKSGRSSPQPVGVSRSALVQRIVPDAASVTDINALEPHHCRWINGDPSMGKDQYHWCGKTAVPGKSWCSEHLLLVYAPPIPRREPPAFNAAQPISLTSEAEPSDEVLA